MMAWAGQRALFGKRKEIRWRTSGSARTRWGAVRTNSARKRRRWGIPSPTWTVFWANSRTNGKARPASPMPTAIRANWSPASRKPRRWSTRSPRPWTRPRKRCRTWTNGSPAVSAVSGARSDHARRWEKPCSSPFSQTNSPRSPRFLMRRAGRIGSRTRRGWTWRSRMRMRARGACVLRRGSLSRGPLQGRRSRCRSMRPWSSR